LGSVSSSSVFWNRLCEITTMSGKHDQQDIIFLTIKLSSYRQISIQTYKKEGGGWSFWDRISKGDLRLVSYMEFSCFHLLSGIAGMVAHIYKRFILTISSHSYGGWNFPHMMSVAWRIRKVNDVFSSGSWGPRTRNFNVQGQGEMDV
jgi:hypothetical protein